MMKFTRLLALAAALILSACAAQTNLSDPDTLATVKARFANGDTTMSCGLGCAGNFGYHQKELQQDYDTQHWDALANLVLSIGFDGELSWFYLGAAAQGLGDDSAAQHYYVYSYVSSHPCSHPINACNGLNLPALTATRLDLIDQKLLASPVFAQLSAPLAPPSTASQIHLINEHGLVAVPVLLNGKLPLLFAVDSGASVVNIPAVLAEVLFKDGTLQKSDIVGRSTAIMGNGQAVPAIIFKIHRLQVGNVVVTNVLGSVSPGPGILLLGQSFLHHFKSWQIDNTNQALILQQ